MTSIMKTEENNELYKNHMLTIPDLMRKEDIPIIINWFLYYSIADVENVEICMHPEQEYYVEDRVFYGYAVIKIRKWYKNNASQKFYNNLISGSARMTYDVHDYWDVMFYEDSSKCNLYQVNNIVDNSDEKIDNVNVNEKNYNIIENMTHDVTEKTDLDKDNNNIYDVDLSKNKDNEFDERNVEEDFNCEYVKLKLKLKHSQIKTRSQTKCKEDKSKTMKLNTENITLEDIIAKKNKNYVKRDKRKLYKNEWRRRLRVKLND